MSNDNGKKNLTMGAFIVGLISLLLAGGATVVATAVVVEGKADRAVVEQKANRSDVKELREMVYDIKEDVAVIRREVLRSE